LFSNKKYYDSSHNVLPIVPSYAFSEGLYDEEIVQKIASGIPVIAYIKDGRKRNQ
jgi:hypothetical protein